MCVVSMVTDHYMKRWPSPTHISPSIYQDIEELIRKAKEYDRLTGQPDCPTDDKQKWLDEFAKRQPPVVWDKGTPFQTSSYDNNYKVWPNMRELEGTD